MTLVLKAERLFDGTGSPPVENGVVVVEDGRISAVGAEKSVPLPEAGEIVELADCTLLPGLIDAHFHFIFAVRKSFNKDQFLARYENTPEMELLQMARAAQMMLAAGFTTVRDAGGGTVSGGHITNLMVALRDAIAAGILPGSRLVVAGLTVITNAHLHNLLKSTAGVWPRGLTADGPWELRKLVREHLRLGADFIKTSASGGVGPPEEEIKTRNMTPEEINAIADEAHAFNKLAACHCHTPDSIRMALAADFDTIEHCAYTDDDAVDRLARSGKILVPTLSHRSQEAIDEWIRVGGMAGTLKKMIETRPIYLESFKRYHQAGVKMACGTDHSDLPRGSAMEIRIYVELGMTPMEAIQTATINAAEAIGRERDLGTLEPGKLADVIAVKGNPLADIRILEDIDNVVLVMKEGKIAVDKRPGSGDGRTAMAQARAAVGGGHP